MPAHHFFDFGGFIVDSETIDDSSGRLILPDHFHLFSRIAELYNRFIQRIHRRDVPEMGAADIDDDISDILFVIKRIGETVGRVKKDLPDKFVDARTTRLFVRFVPVHKMADFIGKEQ